MTTIRSLPCARTSVFASALLLAAVAMAEGQSPQAAETPTCLTCGEPGQVWDFVLSPDGRHIAYGTRIPQGGSIWRVDLDLPDDAIHPTEPADGPGPEGGTDPRHAKHHRR